MASLIKDVSGHAKLTGARSTSEVSIRPVPFHLRAPATWFWHRDSEHAGNLVSPQRLARRGRCYRIWQGTSWGLGWESDFCKIKIQMGWH